MRTLERSECAVLHLGLRSHWYRMIESGEKRIEFREAKPYWNTRIKNWTLRMPGKTPVLEFQCGYGRFSPRMWFVAGNGDDVVSLFCSAGVPEEQGERCLAQFEQWRRKGDGKKLITAIMTWAQMPYTAEEGGAK